MKYSKFLVSTLVAAAAMTVPAFADGDANTILINFDSANGTGASSISGTWNDTTGASGSSDSLVFSDGSLGAGSVTWTSANTWAYTTDVTDGMLKGYLDDTQNQLSINVSTNFLVTDVTIYCATDTSSAFTAKSVNGTYYTYADGIGTIMGTGNWGASRTASIAEGTNALTISGIFSSNLSISSNSGQAARGCIAGVKIELYTGTKTAVSLSGSEQTWTDSAIGSASWTNSTADAGTYAAFDLSADTSVNVTGTAITTDAITASGAGTLTLSGGAISLIGPGVVRTDSDSAAIVVNNSLTFASGGTISGNVSFGENSSITVSSGSLNMSSVSSFPTTASISLAQGTFLKTSQFAAQTSASAYDLTRITGTGSILFDAVTGNAGYDGKLGVSLSQSFTGDFVLDKNIWLSFADGHSSFGGATVVLSGDALFHSTQTVAFGNKIRLDGSAAIWADSSNATVTLNGEVSGSAGTLNRRGGGAMIFNNAVSVAQFNQENGATTFNGTTDITTLNFSGGSLNFGTNAAVTVGEFKATAGTLALSSGAVNVTSALSAKGANSVINISGDSSITSNSGSVRAVDGGTINQSGGVVNALSLRIHDEQNSTQTSTFNLTGGVMNLSSENTANSTSAGVLIGHWGQGKGVLNVEGGVLNAAKTVAVVSWTSPGELNISGGEINLKGIDLTGQGTNAATVTLSDTGRLNIGANGLKIGNNTNSTKTYVFNGGTLGALDSWSSSVDVAVGGNVEIDTTKRVVNTSGASTASADSVEIALSGILSGDGGLTKTGAGTLTLSGANTFTGGVEISAGTLTAGNAAALGTGTTKLSGGQLSIASGVTLNLSALTIALGDAYSSDAAIVGEGSLTLLADAATITLTKAEEVAIAFFVDEATKSYQIFDSSLAGDFSTDNFSLGEGWDGWQVSSYDSSTGVLTLSIPEPSAFGLLAGAGALALVAARRRRRRAK